MFSDGAGAARANETRKVRTTAVDFILIELEVWILLKAESKIERVYYFIGNERIVCLED